MSRFDGARAPWPRVVAGIVRSSIASLFHHRGMALFSLVAAFGVWFVIQDVENPRVQRCFPEDCTRVIPVEAINADQYIPTSTFTVGVQVEGREDDLQKLFDVNVKGAILCARAATRPMMKAKWGRVVFLSSVVGEMGNVGQTAYAATKAALLGVTKSIAREYASRNITVNAVAPGYIDTDMTSGMTDAMKETLNKLIPLGRTGSARDVAAACAYLASEEAGYVTGQVLRVNGGMYV
mgnify:CR=1 FL=1